VTVHQLGRAEVTAPPSASPLVRLAVFFTLAYGISWAWVIPWAVTGHTVVQGRGWPTHFPSLLGPLLAAFIVTAWWGGAGGMRDLIARMARWRIGWRWWLAVLSPLLCLFAVLAVMAAAGMTLPGRSDFAVFSGLPAGLGLLGVWAAVAIVNGFGEETGWRGYALPQLQRRFGPVTASLILSVAWAGWHIPQFFFLQSYENFRAPMIPVFVIGLAAGSVVLTWLYNRTGGSILAVALWHGLYNLTGATRAATAGSGMLSAIMWTFVVVLALVLLAAEWRAHRTGRRTVMGPRQPAGPGPAPGN
jgi:CAAX protease family protein